MGFVRRQRIMFAAYLANIWTNGDFSIWRLQLQLFYVHRMLWNAAVTATRFGNCTFLISGPPRCRCATDNGYVKVKKATDTRSALPCLIPLQNNKFNVQLAGGARDLLKRILP
jgi:hypothetical protein